MFSPPLITEILLIWLAMARLSHGSLINITWTNSLDSPEDLEAFKKGPDGFALEMMTLSVDGETVLMGVDPTGTLTFKDCLIAMSEYNQKASVTKYVKLDIRFNEVLEKMKPELSKVGFINWIVFHFDYFKGPGGSEATMRVHDFRTKVIGKIPMQGTISFGFTVRMVGEPGYTLEMVKEMKTNWKQHGFESVFTPEFRTLKTSFALHIVHLSVATEETQKELKEFIGKFHTVEMRLGKDQLRMVNYQSFKEFLGDFGIDKVYFNVPPEFHQAFQDGGLPGMEGYSGQQGVRAMAILVLWSWLVVMRLI